MVSGFELKPVVAGDRVQSQARRTDYMPLRFQTVATLQQERAPVLCARHTNSSVCQISAEWHGLPVRETPNLWRLGAVLLYWLK